MRSWRRVRAKAAQLDSFVAKVLQHVNDLVEVGRRLLLIEEVGPAADGEFALHGCSSMDGDFSETTRRPKHLPPWRRRGGRDCPAAPVSKFWRNARQARPEATWPQGPADKLAMDLAGSGDNSRRTAKGTRRRRRT